MSEVKRVVSDRILAWGSDAVGRFDAVETELNRLVEAIAACDYYGDNGTQFKNTSGGRLVEFSGTVTMNMDRMNEAISEASSFIVEALGGVRLSLEPPQVSVRMPEFDQRLGEHGATREEIDGLESQLNNSFALLSTQFEDNRSTFDALGEAEHWVGQEYDDARSEMALLTGQVISEIEDATTEMRLSLQSQRQILFGG